MSIDTGTGPLWLFLLAFSVFNLCWIAVYVLAIRAGFRDQYAPIPLPALALNMAWDLNVMFVLYAPFAEKIAIGIYLALQLVLLWQCLIYGRKDFPAASRAGWTFAVAFALCFAVYFIAALSIELNDILAWEIGFIDNFVNSAMFIWMFTVRPGTAGQSIYIGWLKLVGTGIISVAAVLYPWVGYADSKLLPFLYVSIFMLDIAYVWLVWQRARKTKPLLHPTS